MKIEEKYRKELDMAFEYVLKNTSLERKEVENYLILDYFLFLPNGEYKKKLISDIYDRAMKNQEGYEDIYCFTLDELELVRSIQTSRLKKIVLCMLIWRRQENEIRDYVKFDFDKIFSILFSPKEMKNLKREELVPLSKYGVDFRVVGSKKPKTCFKLPVPYSDSEITWVGTKAKLSELL